MIALIRMVLTGADNQTFDIARILWVVGVLAFLAVAVWNTFILGHAPSLSDFGVGFGVVMAGGGAGVGFKAHAEPKG